MEERRKGRRGPEQASSRSTYMVESLCHCREHAYHDSSFVTVLCRRQSLISLWSILHFGLSFISRSMSREYGDSASSVAVDFVRRESEQKSGPL
jgi:hypothetical protein